MFLIAFVEGGVQNLLPIFRYTSRTGNELETQMFYIVICQCMLSCISPLPFYPNLHPQVVINGEEYINLMEDALYQVNINEYIPGPCKAHPCLPGLLCDVEDGSCVCPEDLIQVGDRCISGDMTTGMGKEGTVVMGKEGTTGMGKEGTIDG